MLNFRAALLSVLPLATLGVAQPANAAILGPDSGVCASGDGPAVLVRVTGLKNRAGTVRARTFAGSNPSSWFDKRSYLKRTQVATPEAGAVEICMPVPKPGAYVVDIRHDVNNNGDTDRADGGGASGNPKISLFDVIFGRKPPASKVAFNVGPGVTPITIVVNYASGGGMKPVETTSR
jgi:uncharacterized protein (DUF2141 family)